MPGLLKIRDFKCCIIIGISLILPREASPFTTEYKQIIRVEYKDLSNDDKFLWDKYHKKLVPGLAKFKTGCSKRVVTATSYWLDRKKNKQAIYATQVGKEKIIFGPTSTSYPFVIWTRNGGKMISVDGRSFVFTGKVLIIEKMESISYAYGCTGKSYNLVQLSE